MNLPDLIRRKDRGVVVTGQIETAEPRTRHGRYRIIRLARGAALRIRDAHECTALAGFPTDPHWSVLGDWPGGVSVAIADAGGEAPLGSARADLFKRPAPLRLDWPARTRARFDLIVAQTGSAPALLSVGPLLDPRRKLMALARGVGVEVGPGLNPLVRPREGVDVSYVEEKTAGEWSDTYARGKTQTSTLTAEIVERTRIGSASTLDQYDAESLDFIFCNHVFEHLMNPMQVLRNWLSRLKPGGVVLGVVPDARFSFDLRQPLSTLEDFRAESDRGGFEKTEEKYRRWVRHTAPNAKVSSLKRRDYSIHVHYYTPEAFRVLADALRTESLVDSLFLDTAPNNKDFGFVLTKTRSAA